MHLAKLDASEKRTATTDTLLAPQSDLGAQGGLRPNVLISLVSESGLYKLALRSDKPQAKPFQDWVTQVVLPTIRKTGSYVMGEEKLDAPSLTPDERA